MPDDTVTIQLWVGERLAEFSLDRDLLADIRIEANAEHASEDNEQILLRRLSTAIERELRWFDRLST